MAEASPSQTDRDLTSIADARSLARRAKLAWLELAEFSQDQIDAIVDAMASGLAALRDRGGRLFVLGIGGAPWQPRAAR